MTKPNRLIKIVDALLAEARPARAALLEIPAPGRTPVEQAFTGLSLAINKVIEADHVVQLADWETRQGKLLDWREHLRAHPIPHPDTVQAEAARGVEIDFSTALLGTNRWYETLTELEELSSWAERRHDESSRKLKTIGDASRTATGVVRRGDERVKEIARSTTRKLQALDQDDDRSRHRIIAEGQRDVATVAEVAIRRINHETRRVLDSDENTAAISVEEWLDRHGLDASGN